MAQDEFSICKAEKRGDAVASSIDDNAADGNSDKPLGQMCVIQYTSTVKIKFLLY